MGRLPDYVAPPADYKWKTGHDIAKRMADTVALHQVALDKGAILAGRYVAIRLADGGSDGIAYDTYAECVTHQRHEATRMAYFKLPLERWNAPTCDVLLWYTRKCYDSGWRVDPTRQLIIPQAKEHLR